jgi:hypothetical protein
LTLNDVIERYGIGGDAVLKMDCEGREYDIVLNDYVHIKLFDEVILEYHANVGGKPGKLLKVLSRDYRCRVVEKLGRNFGIIHCEMVDAVRILWCSREGRAMAKAEMKRAHAVLHASGLLRALQWA